MIYLSRVAFVSSKTSRFLTGGVGLLYGYPTRYGIYDSRGLIEVMKLLVDWLNREFLSGADRATLLARLQARGLRESTCSAVASIEFAHNCIILRRRELWEEAFDGREYLFADRV
jgi:hypothetical protein